MTEHDFQVSVINLLRRSNIFCFAVPNGGLRNKFTAKKLKAEGVLAGVADIVILLKNKCIFVELKNPYKKSNQTDTQKAFQKQVEQMGYEYHLLDSWAKFEAFLSRLIMLQKVSKI